MNMLKGLIRLFLVLLLVIVQLTFIFCKLMQKPRKQHCTLKVPGFEFDFTPNTSKRCNKQENCIKLKLHCCGNCTADPKIFIFPFFSNGPENHRNHWDVRKYGTLCLMSSIVLSNRTILNNCLNTRLPFLYTLPANCLIM